MSIRRAGLAGLLFALLAVPVAGADVTVRVEGTSSQLLVKSVPLTGPSVTKTGVTCNGNSAAGAFDRAVGSANWDASAFGASLFIDRIFGETMSFSGPPSTQRYWSFEHNNVSSQQGICEYTPADGDELLFFAACGGPSSQGCADGTPLDITAPATATTGVAFTVTVRQFDDFSDPAVPSPAANAVITGGPAVQITGADGKTQMTIGTPGTYTLIANKGKQVRDQTTVVVNDPPVYSIPTPEPTVTPTATPGPDDDTPVSTVLGIKDGQVFKKRRKAPRTLRASIEDASALKSVTLGLQRRNGKKCFAFSDAKGRFERVRCTRFRRFAVGTGASLSYLLPKRLGPGRYTLDVRATDVEGNAEQESEGRNRVVFTVK